MANRQWSLPDHFATVAEVVTDLRKEEIRVQTSAALWVKFDDPDLRADAPVRKLEVGISHRHWTAVAEITLAQREPPCSQPVRSTVARRRFASPH